MHQYYCRHTASASSAMELLEGRTFLSHTHPAPPMPDHIVVVVEENHSYSEVVGSPSAPFINSLAKGGALFTDSRAVTHPSQPNYLALFSGSTQGVTDDSSPFVFGGPNLASELVAAKRSFIGYSEGLPYAGFTGATSDDYARKHNPWVNFTNVSPKANQPLSAFPAVFRRLPTISFVVPDQSNDMHDGSVAAGDAWLATHLGAYAKWAMRHNSLLVVTWDEDDGSSTNHVPTLMYGATVRPGRYTQRIDHYSVLRMLEDLYGLARAGASATAAPITGVWTAPPAATVSVIATLVL